MRVGSVSLIVGETIAIRCGVCSCWDAKKQGEKIDWLTRATLTTNVLFVNAGFCVVGKRCNGNLLLGSKKL